MQLRSARPSGVGNPLSQGRPKTNKEEMKTEISQGTKQDCLSVRATADSSTDGQTSKSTGQIDYRRGNKGENTVSAPAATLHSLPLPPHPRTPFNFFP
mmetsp:Transcript_55249/g.108082  ORF Transcript_55249/g.108082 Transcript_55249/m.108082 type:complete len:98 (+) Transcript_55249:1234-1527(+)